MTTVIHTRCPYQCEDGYYLVEGHGGGQYPCPRCRPFENAQLRKNAQWVLVCGILFSLVVAFFLILG